MPAVPCPRPHILNALIRDGTRVMRTDHSGDIAAWSCVVETVPRHVATWSAVEGTRGRRVRGQPGDA